MSHLYLLLRNLLIYIYIDKKEERKMTFELGDIRCLCPPKKAKCRNFMKSRHFADL